MKRILLLLSLVLLLMHSLTFAASDTASNKWMALDAAGGSSAWIDTEEVVYTGSREDTANDYYANAWIMTYNPAKKQTQRVLRQFDLRNNASKVMIQANFTEPDKFTKVERTPFSQYSAITNGSVEKTAYDMILANAAAWKSQSSAMEARAAIPQFSPAYVDQFGKSFGDDLMRWKLIPQKNSKAASDEKTWLDVNNIEIFGHSSRPDEAFYARYWILLVNTYNNEKTIQYREMDMNVGKERILYVGAIARSGELKTFVASPNREYYSLQGESISAAIYEYLDKTYGKAGGSTKMTVIR